MFGDFKELLTKNNDFWSALGFPSIELGEFVYKISADITVLFGTVKGIAAQLPSSSELITSSFVKQQTKNTFWC